MTASRRPDSPGRAGLVLPPVYPIIDIDICRMRGIDPHALAAGCLEGGARLVQVRQKGHDTGGAALLAVVRSIVAAASPVQALVVVNDRADIAAMAGAGGVHVGQQDLAPETVRAIAGPDVVVGLSTHTREQVDAALAGDADYVAVGPVFSTATKDTGYDARGLELVSFAAGRGKPVVAIGGITLASAGAVLAAGAASVAIISDLLSDAGGVALRIREFLRGGG